MRFGDEGPVIWFGDKVWGIRLGDKVQDRVQDRVQGGVQGWGQFQISVVPRAVRLAWFSWPGSRAMVGRVAAVGLGVHAPRGGFRARGWRCRKSTHLGTHTIKLGLEFELQRTVHRS